MKTTFRPRLLNGPFGDPALLIHLRWQGRALLVDCGRLGGRLERALAGNLARVREVFVSHAHMDHFMGFDQLLRLLLARGAELRVFGPPGIIDRVEGKLAGYSWNLVDEYPFVLEVVEVGPKEMRTARFAAARRFRREAVGGPRFFGGVVLDDPVFIVHATILDHRIPCLGFCVAERSHLNVRPERLASLGLPPGRWLGELKEAVRAGRPEETMLSTPAGPRPLGELRAELLVETPGQRIAYVVDALYSPENAARIIELARGADVFFCEAPFLDEDRDQAARRYHLTARQAGALARAAGVRRLEVFHFSPRYEGARERLVAEAMAEFRAESVAYEEPGSGSLALAR